MNLLLFEPEEIAADGMARISDRRSEHVTRVLGCKPGDLVRAGIVDGPVGCAELTAVEKTGVSFRFTAEATMMDPPLIDLIMGLVRPIMLKKILAQAASLGVGRIFLINANRVEKSFFTAGLLREENYRQCLLHGLEQARDTRLPRVSIHQRFRPFIEDFVPTIAEDYSRLLVAHPEAAYSLKQAVDVPESGRVLLAIGPEGGWVDFEVERFEAQSFVPISLGNRILRTDTAVVALLSQIMLLREADDSLKHADVKSR